MARPSLNNNVKFKRLIRILNIPRPHVRGYLEAMWDTANECGNPILGGCEEVEAACEWPGEPGALFKALCECRLIQECTSVQMNLQTAGCTLVQLNLQTATEGQDKESDGQTGVWEIHDYWDHCPKYVKDRLYQEMRRKDTKKAVDKLRRQSPTIGDNLRLVEEARQNSSTPAPAPAPAPAHTQIQRASEWTFVQQQSGETQPATESQDTLPRDVIGKWEQFWSRYPRKSYAVQSQHVFEMLLCTAGDLGQREALFAEIMAGVSRWLDSDEWRRGVINNPQTWLNERRWKEHPKSLADSKLKVPQNTAEQRLADDAKIKARLAEQEAKEKL